MWFALWLSASALAQEAPPPAPAEAPNLADGYGDGAYWQGVYGRATKTARTGLVLGIAGPPVVVGGAIILVFGILAEDFATSAFGVLTIAGGGMAMLVGPPLLAGGAMRARRALEEQGVSVSPQLGQIAWGCVAGFWLVSLVPQTQATVNIVGAASLAFYAGSLVSGGLLLSELRRAEAYAGGQVGDGRDWDVYAVPWAGRDVQGVSLAVSF
jgi:hypothetical protein